MALSQGSKPIVLMDGDNKDLLQAIEKKYPDVPIIELPNNTTLEDIVPRKNYFDALQEELDNSELSESKFNEWLEDRDYKHAPFSKKVEFWIQEKFDGAEFSKQAIIRKALDETNVDEIDLTKIEELLEKAKEQLQSPI